MPWRSSSESSTLRPLYGTPRWSRICTTWPEKPHIGNCGVPFMNSTTSLAFTSLSMNCSMPMADLRSVLAPAPTRICAPRVGINRTLPKSCVCDRNARARRQDSSSSLPSRDAGLQCKRMELAAHFGLEGVIDQLVLLHAGFAAECLREHGRGVVVAIARKIAYRHLGVWNTRLDQPLDVICLHRHCGFPFYFPALPTCRSVLLCLDITRKTPHLFLKIIRRIARCRPTCGRETS